MSICTTLLAPTNTQPWFVCLFVVNCYYDICSSIAATVPGPVQSIGVVGPLTRNSSVDSAYAEGGKVVVTVCYQSPVLCCDTLHNEVFFAIIFRFEIKVCISW